MSQPAARLGDLTAHGGAVTSGNPTVLIGGRPAATVGDLHVCPLCSPGPHVGGPVMVGAPTVLIGGRPAARMGDPCVCAAPAPDVIVSGCPTVLVGAASGAGGAAASAAAASAAGAALRPGTAGTGTTARPLSPWVGVAYADAAGRPVSGWDYHAEGGGDERDGAVGTGGQVWCDGLAGGGAVAVGLVGVYGCRWDRGEARVGEAVGMSARCAGVEDGELAHFEVWRETATAGGAVERAKVWEVMGEVRGGRVEASAPFVYDRDAGSTNLVETHGASSFDDVVPPAPSSASGAGADNSAPYGLAPLAFVAEVVVAGVHRTRSGHLRLRDQIEVEIVDAEGAPIPRAWCTVQLPDGTVQDVQADSQGVLTIDAVDPGDFLILEIRSDTRRWSF